MELIQLKYYFFPRNFDKVSMKYQSYTKLQSQQKNNGFKQKHDFVAALGRL